MTKLIVAQRISTIMDADLILVLDQKGKVVGQGTSHKELLATNEATKVPAHNYLEEELEHGKIKRSFGLETNKPYMAGLQLPLLIAVVAAVISSIITVYGPN